jgi:hypothetical protein
MFVAFLMTMEVTVDVTYRPVVVL